MGRKTKNSSDGEQDLSSLSEDGRLIVTILERKIENILKFFSEEIRKRDDGIDKLEKDVLGLRRNVARLEEKVNDAEAYERRDAVVISGDALPEVTVGENVNHLACSIVREKLKLSLDPSEVSAAHRLGAKPKNQLTDKRNIIVKLCRRETKRELISACKNLKPSGLFINENLTPKSEQHPFLAEKSQTKISRHRGELWFFRGKSLCMDKTTNRQW